MRKIFRPASGRGWRSWCWTRSGSRSCRITSPSCGRRLPGSRRISPARAAIGARLRRFFGSPRGWWWQGRFGTGVCLLVQRDPTRTAKLVASIDQVSHGRFRFGIGVGWNAEEMADHRTTDFKGRHKLARERIGAMTAIWTQTKPEYHGDLVDFGPMLTWPKP